MNKLLYLLVVFGLLAAACGSDAADDSTSEVTTSEVGEAFPVEVAGVTIESQPQRIVSLSPTSTEVLFAIGAADQVIAVDSLSNFPAEAPITELSSFEPNIEAIAEFEPDLVFTSFDPGDLVSGLDALGIPTITHGGALSLDDAYAQIEQVGAATGHTGDAAEVVLNMQTDLAALAAELPDFDAPPTYFHEIDNTLYTATSQTFIGEVYSLAGLDNIADPADTDGFGFPQLSEEFLLQADPDLIFLSDVLYGENTDTVAARPGWDQLTAVQNGRVVELDSDVASRWGPRIVDLFAQVVESINVEVPA